MLGETEDREADSSMNSGSNIGARISLEHLSGSCSTELLPDLLVLGLVLPELMLSEMLRAVSPLS